jgi:diguanylate cyclase (GGDEF)-like protein
VRDTSARERDLATALRDRAAAARDHQADDEVDAARDRAEAARDRRAAARERGRATTQREAAVPREPPSAKRRGPGLAAVQREIDRARRRKGLLVVAYVDFDRLRASNDIDDQAAGDDRVKQLVGVMKTHLGPNELIVRLGGDEFLCALPGATIETVERRVDGLAGQLTATAHASRVNMGLAELVLDDNASDLIQRAHAHADLLAVHREDPNQQQRQQQNE